MSSVFEDFPCLQSKPTGRSRQTKAIDSASPKKNKTAIASNVKGYGKPPHRPHEALFDPEPVVQALCSFAYPAKHGDVIQRQMKGCPRDVLCPRTNPL